MQERITISNRSPFRGVQERKVFYLTEPKRLHPEYNFGQISAKDFGIRKISPFVKIEFVIETDTHPLTDPPSPTSTLLSATLCYLFDREAFRSLSTTVTTNSGES
jgi:hypothetical protein